MQNAISRINVNKNILVILDQNLIPSIRRNNHAFIQNSLMNNIQNISINLTKLVYAAGTVQTRRGEPTSFQKFSDREDLLEFIKDCDDFCIKKHDDLDVQRTLSEDFGVGLSVLTADHFYGIDWNTVTKIKRTRGSKPDIKCFSLANELIIIEAKGTTSVYTRNTQKSAALRQKNTVASAHVKVGSCTLLNENSISDVDFFDPPFIPTTDIRYEKALQRADHYARVFNLIGQKELSIYFSLMRQRIVHNKNFSEFNYKQDLFSKIKMHYIRLSLGQHFYYGSIERLDNELFIFTGIEEELLNAFDFINFKDYKEQYFEEEGNRFFLFSDGLCIAFLTNIRFFEDQIRYEQIPHHYEAFTIVDFDHSKEPTIKKYLSYLFEKVGCKTIKETTFNFKLRPDLLVSFKDKKIWVEVKKYLNLTNARFILERLAQLQSNEFFKILLITNSKPSMNISDMFLSKEIELIDRTALTEIIKRKEALLRYIK